MSFNFFSAHRKPFFTQPISQRPSRYIYSLCGHNVFFLLIFLLFSDIFVFCINFPVSAKVIIVTLLKSKSLFSHSLSFLIYLFFASISLPFLTLLTSFFLSFGLKSLITTAFKLSPSYLWRVCGPKMPTQSALRSRRLHCNTNAYKNDSSADAFKTYESRRLLSD